MPLEFAGCTEAEAREFASRWLPAWTGQRLDDRRIFGPGSLNIQPHVPDMSYVQPAPLKRPTLLRRIAATFSLLTPRSLCSLVHSPLPELREVGAEWRALPPRR